MTIESKEPRQEENFPEIAPENIRPTFELTTNIDHDITELTCLNPVHNVDGKFEPVLHNTGSEGLSHPWGHGSADSRVEGVIVRPYNEFAPSRWMKVEEVLKVHNSANHDMFNQLATGLRHAEAMLREPEKIRESYRDYQIVFNEVWKDKKGDSFVWCLKDKMTWNDKDAKEDHKWELARLRLNEDAPKNFGVLLDATGFNDPEYSGDNREYDLRFLSDPNPQERRKKWEEKRQTTIK